MNFNEVISKLPSWLIFTICAAILVMFLYAVITGRSVDVWGFKIGAHQQNPLKSEANNITRPLSVERPPIQPPKSPSCYEKITLTIGRPQETKLTAQKLILRKIEKKSHKTIYSRDEAEFALIEFKDGNVCISEGVYRENLNEIWLPYFTVGDFDYHCAYRVNANYQNTRAWASFFWVDNINSHLGEVDLNIIHLFKE